MKEKTKEAHRYLDNAKEILSSKANKQDGYYLDKKYVKLAGHAAYSGVLVALDEVLKTTKKNRKSVEWYQSELAKMDKKLLNTFGNIYEILHLMMGYDGFGKASVVQDGLGDAEKILEWVENRL